MIYIYDIKNVSRAKEIRLNQDGPAKDKHRVEISCEIFNPWNGSVEHYMMARVMV